MSRMILRWIVNEDVQILVGKWAMFAITLLVALSVVTLRAYGRVSQDTVSAAILAVLALLAFALLRIQSERARIEREIICLRGDIDRFGASEVLRPYEEWSKEIRSAIRSADEVWILSRSCANIWVEYDEEIDSVFRGGGRVRLLMLDPKSDTPDIVTSGNILVADSVDGMFLKKQIRELWEKLGKTKKREISTGRLKVNATKFPVPWTLFLVNPSSKSTRPAETVIFVQVGMFTEGQHRPMFRIRFGEGDGAYRVFQRDAERMWEVSRDVKDEVLPERQRA